MAEIRVEGLTHVYSAGTPFEQTAIEDVNLVVPQGQFAAVIGHTGSGKSTFIQHLDALLQPTGGRVLLDGQDINRDKYTRRDVKWKVGLVFQYPEYQLFEETVYRDIAFGPKNQKLSDAEIDERVREAARFTGVDEALFERSPLELSGGQKRRIAIAGVIAMQPEIIVLDEPTAMLDPRGRKEVVDTVYTLCRARGITVVFITHHMDECIDADRLIVMSNGSVLADGTPAEVFADRALIEREGLDVPETVRLLQDLRTDGLDLPADALDVDSCADAIAQALSRRA